MNYPEFVELIQNHDFICLTETKTDDLDSIIVPGYSFKSKNRIQIHELNPVVLPLDISLISRNLYTHWIRIAN